MKKYSSSFNTSFISEPGIRLTNNDYFAYVEMDRYACYVIADGLSDRNDLDSAKEAIEGIITQFQSAPSMSRGGLTRYLKRVNKEFLEKKSYEQLKASVTVLITDYEKIRYACAGNTRLSLFRDGRFFHTSTDMSLSQELADKEMIQADMVARHEERNNLYCYLGQEQFSPYISPKIKLKNGDMITLYTRGIWENIKDRELEQILKDAGNEPQAECDKIEQYLLHQQVEDLENYTLALIYVDKVFTDPKRDKKRKLLIIWSLIILAVILILCLVFYILHRKKQEKIKTMNDHIEQTEGYIADENFIRAKEECEKAIEGAETLKDEENRRWMTQYLMFLEAMLLAEEKYESGDYLEAENLYLKARARSRYADNCGADFIQVRLNQIGRYRDVYDHIAIGDKLLELERFEQAEEKYIQAKKDAAVIYYDEGKKQALDALEKLHEQWDAYQEETTAQAKERAEAEVSAAELLAKGVSAYEEGKLDEAKVFYLMAQGKYEELKEDGQAAKVAAQILALEEEKEGIRTRSAEAAVFEEQARIYTENKEFDLAKEQYQFAKNIYLEIGQTSKADEVQSRVDIIDTKLNKQEKDEAKEAREQGKTVSGNNG